MTTAALPLPVGLAVAALPPAGEALGREAEREAPEACRRGEREAFDRLVVRYQRDVYRLCYRYVNNHEDAVRQQHRDLQKIHAPSHDTSDR